MALPKKHRLLSQNDFKTVIIKGKTVKSSFLFIRFIRNRLGYGRVGINIPLTVSKKAVVRNRIKRQISNYLKEQEYLKFSLDSIIIISPVIVDKSSKEIKSSLEKTIAFIKSQSENI